MSDIEITEKDILEFERKLVDNKGEDRVEHFTTYLLEKADEGSTGQSFKCSFPIFEEKMKGVKTGELVTITGKTGEGKTLFAESWMRSMMLEGCQAHDPNKKVNACIYSYEVQPQNILAKYVNTAFMPLYLPMKLEVMDFTWLRNSVYEAKLKYGCNVFVLDHLHFLVDMSTKQNQSLNIGAFMRRLKHDIALSLNVVIIIIAHQKGVAKGEEPSLEGIRDSALIAAESDTVIIVWRRKNFSSKEVGEISNKNMELANTIMGRSGEVILGDEFSDRFAMVQIAKGRREGIYRWSKLFQKQGHYLEEV